MSRSVTVKPTAGSTVNRGRGGRGRGRGNPTIASSQARDRQKTETRMNTQDSNRQSEASGYTLGSASGNESSQVPVPAQEDRMQRRDAYTVIAPNEKKRQQITNQAKREEEAFRKHKEEKRLGAVSYVGTVGGGAVPKTETRQNMQQQLNQSSQSPFAKSRHYRDVKRKEEDLKLGRMKAEQRQKAERNTERDSARHQRLGEERRLANEAFLARIEQENKQKLQQSKQQKVLSTTAGKTTEDLPRPAEASSQCDGTACASSSSSNSSTSPLELLQRRYPHCDKDVLSDLLLQANGDIDSVCDLLG